MLREPDREAFCRGVAVGICLYQQKLLAAHGQGEPLRIDGEPYYIRDGREQLQDAVDEACK